MLKKLLFAAVAAFLVFLAGREIWRAQVSDETRVRWLLQDTAAAFNAGKVGGVIDGFATDYKDATAKIDRPMLHDALVYLFFRAGQDHVTYRVELPAESLEVRMHEGEPAATAKVVAVLSEKRGDQERRLWELAVDAEVAKVEDGWRFVSSRHKTVSGQHPR